MRELNAARGQLLHCEQSLSAKYEAVQAEVAEIAAERKQRKKNSGVKDEQNLQSDQNSRRTFPWRNSEWAPRPLVEIFEHWDA